MSPLRILVTDADTPKSLAIVRALGKQYEVWTAANIRMALAASSRYRRRHLTHPAHAADFSEWALSVCIQNQIRVVIPPEESSSLLLARSAELFAQHGILVAASPIETLERMVDKVRTIDAARQISIPVPPTTILERTSDAIEAAREMGYPVVIKPTSTRFWDGERFRNSCIVSYAGSDEQLSNIIATIDSRMPPPIVQKFIHGEGVGVCMLMGNDGEVLADFAHLRLRDYRPTGSGSVLRQSIALTSELRTMSSALLRHLGCRGVAMVEFKVDRQAKQIVLMEVNGRFWGSLQLAIDAGVNFPVLLVDWLLGKPVRKPSYKEGVILRWWAGDFVRTLRVLKGRPAGFPGPFPSRLSALVEFLGRQPDGTRNEIHRSDDRRPALVEPISIVRRLIA
jgi:predicted ATP-grasp superfamily ATP-dependent carboligase